MSIPPLQELFPFEHKGGGYFRMKGVKIGESAPMLHGEEAVEYLRDAITKHLNEQTVIGLIAFFLDYTQHLLLVAVSGKHSGGSTENQ